MLNPSHKVSRDLLAGMDYVRDNSLITQRQYNYDALGRPMTRDTRYPNKAIHHNDTFAYNKRSESPRGLGVGLDNAQALPAGRTSDGAAVSQSARRLAGRLDKSAAFAPKGENGRRLEGRLAKSDRFCPNGVRSREATPQASIDGAMLSQLTGALLDENAYTYAYDNIGTVNYYHHHVSHDHNGEIPYSSMKTQKNYIIVNYSLTREIELFRDEYMQMLRRYGFPMPCVEMQIERETIHFAWGYGEAKNLCEWTFGNHLIRCLFVGEMMLLRTRLENKYETCPWIVCTERIETLLRFGFPQGFLVQRIEKHDVPHSSGGEYVIDTQIFQEKVETLLEYNLKRIANLRRNANSLDLYSINELYNLYKEVEAQSIVVNKEALRTQSSIDQEFITDILNRKFALQDV